MNIPEQTPAPVPQEEAKSSSTTSTVKTAGVPTLKHRIAAKATSVTAMCLLLMILALVALTFRDMVTWKETFSGTLGALLGYYIGKKRTAEES